MEAAMIVRRVGPLSVAKVTGVIYALLGAIFGTIFALAAIAGSFAAADQEATFLGPIFGVGAIVFLPLLYGCMGFVVTLIMAWLYNAVAGLVGGIEVDIT
jgi:hypothetical protein